MDSSDSRGWIAGVDEAGRGPLAGPVVVAAVILDPRRPIAGLADSKQLSEKRRDRLAIEIRERALAWAIMLACCAVLAAMAWRFAPLPATHQA